VFQQASRRAVYPVKILYHEHQRLLFRQSSEEQPRGAIDLVSERFAIQVFNTFRVIAARLDS
jgi:hypothetical protein